MFRGRGTGKGRSLAALLMALLRLSVVAAVVELNTTTATIGQTGGDALRATLRAKGTAGPNCSTLIFADHTPTALAIIKGIPEGYAEGGTVLLQLPKYLENSGLANVTGVLDQKLTELTKIGKGVRFITGCLTILFVSDSTTVLEAMLDHSTDGRLMKWKTHCVIVTGLSEAAALASLESKWVFTMMNSHLLLLPQPAVGHSALVYRHEPFSPVGRRTRNIGLYKVASGLVMAIPMHFEKFDNFHGNEMNFSTLSYLPFIDVTITYSPNGTKHFSFTGTDYEVMMSLSVVLNFFPTYIDGPTTWDEVEIELMEHRAFIVPGSYFMMLPRLERFDFIAPYTTIDLAFTMLKPMKISSWDNFMLPFTIDVWIAIFGVLVILSMCLVLILKLSSKMDNVACSKLRGGKLLIGSDIEVASSQAVLEAYGALLGQDFTIKMPHTHSFRILITAWFVFIIVLSTGYKSELISYMTLPKKPFRPETLTELVESNAIITSPPWGHDHQKLLIDSTSREHQILAERYTFVDSIVTGLQMARDIGSAHADKRPYESITIAENFMRADGTSDYYIGRENILSLLGSIPIPHDAPFTRQFDRVMLHLAQGGLYYKWYLDVLERQRIKVAEARDRNPDGTPVIVSTEGEQVKPLTLDQVQGPFWILICGCVLATFFFIVELCIDKCCRKKNDQVGHME